MSIVNESLTRQLWGTRDPVGELLTVDSRGTKRSYQVVGVARDFRPSVRRQPQPEVYVSSTQDVSSLKVVVRSTLSPATVAARIRGVVASEDPAIPLSGISTAGGLLWESNSYTRFHAALLTVFGVFAALLSTSGILAVVMYTVARRTREIGVRIAIGATPRQVVMLLVRETTRPLVVGVAAGLLAMYNLASLLQRQGVLFEVRPFDPGLYASVTVGLSVVAIVAAWLPARRAGRVDPMVALRSE